VVQDHTVIVLIDFDNFYPNAHQQQTFEYLQHDFNRIISTALDVDNLAQYIHIRLYGGWMENGSWSRLASLLQQEISKYSFFPISHPKHTGLLRGSIDLATSLLYLPSVVWQNTRKQKNGLPRIQLDRTVLSSKCEDNKDACPFKIIEKISRKRGKTCSVHGCITTNSSAFKVIEQKMVDTILSLDILFASEQNHVSALIIMSDDIDFHPAIALASTRSNKSIVIACKNVNLFDDFLFTYTDKGIDILNWRM